MVGREITMDEFWTVSMDMAMRIDETDMVDSTRQICRLGDILIRYMAERTRLIFSITGSEIYPGILRVPEASGKTPYSRFVDSALKRGDFELWRNNALSPND